MKSNKEIKIGLFVVVVLVASFFLINYLRGEDILDKEIELVGQYEQLYGLVPSAPVFIKGYKAGEVSEVNYDKDAGSFDVRCSILKDFSVPDDSRMVIYSVDIMGGKGVRIDYGSSEVSAADGDTLCTGFEQDLIGGLGENIAPLFEKVTATLDSLDTTISSVNAILSDKNAASIGRTLAHLESMIADLRSVAESVGDQSGELEAFISNLSAFSGRLDGIALEADSAIAEVTEVLDTLGAFIENIDGSEGTLGKILYDPTLYDSVDSLLSDINSLVRSIKENPKKFLKISVF